MRQILIAVATAASLLAPLGAAQAFPIAPSDSLSTPADITLVSGGCGPYGHRGPFGRCRPNFRRGFYGRPYGFGYHRPFYGRPYGFGYHHHFYGRPYGFHHFY